MEEIEVKRKKSWFRRLRQTLRSFRALLYIGLFLLVLVGVIAFVVNRDRLSAQTVGDLFSWIRSPFSPEEAVSEHFTFDDYLLSNFASFQGGVALLSENRFVIIGKSGQEKFAADCAMKTPTLVVSNRFALAYDRGGTSLLLTDGTGTLWQTQWDGPIFAVALNDNGDFAVASRERGYTSVVTLLDKKQQELYKWFSSDQYVLDVTLSTDAQLLAVTSCKQAGDAFSSRLLLLDTTEAISNEQEGQPVLSRDFPEKMLYTSAFLDANTLCLLMEDGLYFFDTHGELTGQHSFSGRVLRDYSLSGDGFATVILSRTANAQVSEVLTILPDGTAQSFPLTEPPLYLTCAGDYVGLLENSGAFVYDVHFRLVGHTADTGDVRAMLMRDDASALLLDSSGTKVFRP